MPRLATIMLGAGEDLHTAARLNDSCTPRKANKASISNTTVIQAMQIVRHEKLLIVRAVFVRRMHTMHKDIVFLGNNMKVGPLIFERKMLMRARAHANAHMAAEMSTSTNSIPQVFNVDYLFMKTHPNEINDSK